MKQKNDIDVTIVTPMYNEEAVIAENVERLAGALKDVAYSWELLLIDDGSKDASAEAARRAAGSDPRISVISYRRNRGRGYALRTGFAHSSGRYVVTVESDLNYGTDIISRLHDKLVETGADIVIASPYCKGGKVENVPFIRALLSWLGNKVLGMAVAADITTVTGMTRGYRGDVIRNMSLEEDEKEIHLEIVSKANVMGYTFAEIPATLAWSVSKAGNEGQKRKTKFKAGKLIKSHLYFGFNESPFILFGSLGGGLLGAGSFIGLYLFYLFFFKGQVIGDRIVLIMTTVFLILSGMQIFLFYFMSYQNRSIKRELFKLGSNVNELILKGKNEDDER